MGLRLHSVIFLGAPLVRFFAGSREPAEPCLGGAVYSSSRFRGRNSSKSSTELEMSVVMDCSVGTCRAGGAVPWVISWTTMSARCEDLRMRAIWTGEIDPLGEGGRPLVLGFFTRNS